MQSSKQLESKILVEEDKQSSVNLEQEKPREESPLRRISQKHDGRGSMRDLNKIEINPLLKSQDIANIKSPIYKKQPGNNSIEMLTINRNKKTLPPIAKQIASSKILPIDIPETNTGSEGMSPLLKKKISKQPIEQSQLFSESNKTKQIIKVLPNDPSFIQHPILSGFILQGTVNRIRLNNKQAHNSYQYVVSESKEEIMTAEPKTFIMNSLYQIKQKGETIAILQSNFTGSKFQLKKIGEQNSICTIEYQSSVGADHDTRYFKVLIHKESIALETKQPVYDEQLKKYIMNFNKRANLPSLKNFILVTPTHQKQNIVLLGKMNKDEFSLDVSVISPLQAFGIAISSFDPKLFCQ